MVRGRRIATVAAFVLLLVGCNQVTRVTTNEVPSFACFLQSLSADGRWVVFTTRPPGTDADPKTILRDLSTGKNRLLAGPGYSVATDGAISADGSRVVLSEWDTTAEGGMGRLSLWTRRSGVRTRIAPLEESITRGLISSDGRKVLYSDQKGLHTWIYDIGSGTRKPIVRPEGMDPTHALIPVATSATGRYVVAGGFFAGMYLLDTTTGTHVKLPGIGSQYTSALDISADGRWVAYAWLGTGPGLQQLHVWDRTTGTAKALTALTDPEAVGSVSISGDGSRIAYLVTRRNDPRTRLETVARTGGPATPIARSKALISDISIAGDGTFGTFCARGTDLVPGSPAAPNLYTWG